MSEQQKREQLTRCEICGAYINPKFGEVSPAEHAGHAGTLNDPRAPGDYDDICDVCNGANCPAQRPLAWQRRADARQIL